MVDARARVYNEAAFRHFLAIETRRASRSTRRLLLVLVSVMDGAKREAALSPRTAASVFRTLAACVREVDFIGWHSEGVVAGAVLTVGAPETAQARQSVRGRVVQTLNQWLPPDDLSRIHVRVAEPVRLTKR